MGAFTAADFQRNLVETGRIIAAMRAQIHAQNLVIAGSRSAIDQSRLLLKTRLCGEEDIRTCASPA